MTPQDSERRAQDDSDLKSTVDDIDEAFDVQPLSAKGDESGLHNKDEPKKSEGSETDGDVPVANIE